MRDPGRLAAAIEVLADFERRRVPLKVALADWARNARFAGARDRAWVSGLCLDALRRRQSIAAAMGDESARALALGALCFLWKAAPEAVASLAAEPPHGPGPLNNEEIAALRLAPAVGSRPDHVEGDFPEWMTPYIHRAFGVRPVAEMQAFAQRADVDLRINTLKVEQVKGLEALAAVNARAHPFLDGAARIDAPDPASRAPAVTVIPAFNKGWVEVQDLGSQIAACASGKIRGKQVLDLCAGGGGKTLALAALMENSGQIFAYDTDQRRLSPLYQRADRAGVRNLQIIDPIENVSALHALANAMDVVFVDAPCTGSGTWRRHPDTKWRLTPQQLAQRCAEQDVVLADAARFVKPGGRLVYVTCSFLIEENEDRLIAFLAAFPGFSRRGALDAIKDAARLTPAGERALGECVTPEGAIRITPLRLGADGFFVAVLERES